MSNVSELLGEKCGVAAVIAPKDQDAAPVAAKIAQNLEHRGQKGSGVGTKYLNSIYRHHRSPDGFNDTFPNPETLRNYGLHGELALAHTRYTTQGSSKNVLYAQPMLVGGEGRTLMGIHNGQVVNYQELYEDLMHRGARFETDKVEGSEVSDSEVLFQWILHSEGENWPERVANAMSRVEGSVSAVLVTDSDEVIAFKDPWGIRPLSFGRVNGHIAIASETAALRRIGVTEFTEIDKGEMWIFRSGESPQVVNYDNSKLQSYCNFEDFYFSWPTSLRYGNIPVHVIREVFGRQLAREEIQSGRFVVSADIVGCMPDTGRSGAIPFAEELGLPFREIVFKERYGNRGVRSFIESELLRKQVLDDKFDYSDLIEGKVIYLNDDSGIRFATWQVAIKAMRQRYGVKEIHLRSFAPKFVRPCYLGVNIADRAELGAVEFKDGGWVVKSDAQIAQELGANSVAFLSLDGWGKVMEHFGVNSEGFCGYCLGGRGPDSINWNKYDKELALEMLPTAVG